ncbi:MAG TPA: hypothetical protein VKV39_00695 [Candidatus Sulfotelmatobacter sp.]|nr:hypothetical protein [Candidatus Sulfotelmatobacter sp.]
MKTARLVLLGIACFLVSCDGASKLGAPANTVRAYNGTASVGDFLTISIDSTAQTITYKNYTNGESGTVPYTVNADGTYAISDPDGNLLAGYEVPGTVLMVEAANAGPNRDTAALITAIESAPANINTFAGKNFNYVQMRTTTGGIDIGTITVDAQGNVQHAGYWPFGVIEQQSMFNSGNFPASSVVEDASGNFFVIDESGGGQSYVFGTQNGFFAVDTGNGTILSEPKAASKDFDASKAGTYTAIYYTKVNAQMGANNFESGTAGEGKATVVIGGNGAVTITDSQNQTMASGTLTAIADTPYIYDGTASTLPDPLYGMFTFRSASANSQQDVYVSFEGNAVIFSSFQTALPVQQNQSYTYFYGVGLK